MAETIAIWLKGITREVWNALTKKGRAKDAGFTYFTNHPKFHWMTYKQYIDHDEDLMGDDSIVAQLVGVSRETASRWHQFCDTIPVHRQSYLNKVIAVLSEKEIASCATAAKEAPKALPTPTPAQKPLEHVATQKETVCDRNLDGLSDEELLAVADRAFAIIDQRKLDREKKAAVMKQIKRLADEAGISLAEMATAA